MARGMWRKILIGILVIGGLSASTTAHADPVRRYLVNTPGIYLGKLSYLLYGSSKRWPEIARFNRLKNPNLIRLGQWLELPEKADVTTQLWAERAQRYQAFQNARKGGANQTLLTHTTEVKHQRQAPLPQVTPPAANANKDQWIQAGGLAFESKNYTQAVQFYRKAKSQEHESLEAWFGELRSLEAAGRTKELRNTAQVLLQRWPKLKHLSYLDRILNLKETPARAVASHPGTHPAQN